MEPNYETEPAITVDRGRHRLRIHRSTLRRLDNPSFVRLLVNPEEKGIVVERCSASETGAFRLIGESERKHSMEVYSPTLVEEISRCGGFDQYKTVKLFGRQIRGQNAVFFRMDENPEYGYPM